MLTMFFAIHFNTKFVFGGVLFDKPNHNVVRIIGILKQRSKCLATTLTICASEKKIQADLE